MKKHPASNLFNIESLGKEEIMKARNWCKTMVLKLVFFIKYLGKGLTFTT